ncbi:hypothetical protein PAMP_009545 [Pampus punctatissimus]
MLILLAAVFTLHIIGIILLLVSTIDNAVQASSVLACIFSILGIFVFVAQLFTLSKGQRFTISGIFQLLACLCIMIAASIYTDRFHIDEKFGQYGHCFILAWISFALTFISSIIYFVLRKKTA